MRLQKTKIVADIDAGQAVIRFVPIAVREMSEVQKIMEEIEDVAYNNKVTLVVINFARLKQLTSSFLSRLVTLNKSLTQANVGLRLCCMTPVVEEAFKICKLQKLISLYDTEEKALTG